MTQEQINAIDNQIKQYQDLLKTNLAPQTQDALRLSIGQLQANRAKLGAPAPVPEPIPTPTVNDSGQLVNDPRLIPQEVPPAPVALQPQEPAPVTAAPSIPTADYTPVQNTQPMINQTQTTTSTKAGVEIPDYLKQDITKSGQQAIESIGKQQEALDTIQAGRNQVVQNVENITQDFMKDAEQRRLEREAAIAEKQQAYNDSLSALKEEKIDSKRLWKNLSTGQTIGAALAVIAGGLGAALQGRGGNAAMDVLNAAIDRDIKDQYAAYEQKKDISRELKEQISLAEKSFDSKEAQALALKNMKLGVLQTKLDNYAQKATTENQKANLAIAQNNVARQMADNQLKILQLEAPQVTQQVTSISKAAPAAKEQKFTADQTNAAGFANRMERVQKDLSKLDFDPTTLGQATVGKLVPEYLKSDERKQYETLKQNFITAVLRKESGAAIGQDEFVREDLKYFPQPGDGADVLKLKKELRDQVINSMKTAAGSAYTSLPDTQPKRSSLR